jgi:hypothetical protein
MFFSDMARWARRGPVSSLDRDMLYRKPEPPAPETRGPVFLVGLSVGQGAQPTGVAVLEQRKPRSGPATYACRHLRRWLFPGTAYPVLVAHLKAILGAPRLGDPALIFEAGSSTNAVLAILRENRLPVKTHAVEIRSSATDDKSNGSWKVAKATVIETTRKVIQGKRLIFDDRMPQAVMATTPPAQTIYHALETYPYNEASMANEAFACRDGEYDDLVLAVALACWYGERCQRTFAMFC